MAIELMTTKLSVLDLIKKLTLGETIELPNGHSLSITDFDMQDFLSIVTEDNLQKKLGVIQGICNRFHLNVLMEGDVLLGALNLDDRSWTLTASESQSLKIFAKPQPLKLSIDEVISFMKKLPLGQGMAFRSGQDLLITGFSQKAVESYYEFSKDVTDARVLEKAQDAFFVEASATLQKEGLILKVFAIDASSLNREVNPAFGMIVFKAQSRDNQKNPRIALALVKSA